MLLIDPIVAGINQVVQILEIFVIFQRGAHLLCYKQVEVVYISRHGVSSKKLFYQYKFCILCKYALLSGISVLPKSLSI